MPGTMRTLLDFENAIIDDIPKSDIQRASCLPLCPLLLYVHKRQQFVYGFDMLTMITF